MFSLAAARRGNPEEMSHTIDDIGANQVDGHLAALEERLVRQYSRVPAERVRQIRRAESKRFDNARVQVFVPILVERAAKQRLDYLATTR